MVPPHRNDRETWLAAKLNTPLRAALFALVVVGVSYLLAYSGDIFSLNLKFAAILWPANAFQLALMLLLPRRMWPLLITAHAVGLFIHAHQIHLAPLMFVMFMLANIVIFIIAGLGLDHVFGGIPCLDSFKALAKYLLIAVILAPAVSAFVSGFGTPGLYWFTCQLWFLLNALTFLTFGPAIFGWLRPLPRWTRRSRFWVLEAIALFGALVFIGLLIFFFPWGPVPPALLYTLVPLLVWAAVRFGSVGVSTSMVFVAGVSCWAAVHGHGPFAGSDLQRNSLSLVLFLVFATTPFLMLAVVVEERERARLIQQALGGRLIYAQEQERKRIARELHDDISQKLALISVEVEKARQSLNGSAAETKQRLAEVQSHCSEVAFGIHSLSRQLHSSNLDYLGIAGAIAGFCREFSEKYDLVVEFTERNVPNRIADDSALCLFRIAQEALNNARKYSGTKKFDVELFGGADEVHVTVRDQGAGFDLEQVRRTGGLGLVSMEERVHLVRGSLSIHSRPGAGTTIKAVVPIGAANGLFYEEEAPEQAPEAL
jgi:signal transduction histidine kinase